MVKSGGKATMLGQWRIVLRQAEESARAGRIDEALALASRPDVAEHRQAVQLRGRLTQDLINRAVRRAEADDTPGAIADLALAEVHGAAPDHLASARQKLAELVLDEVRASLTGGDPARVLERIDFLARHHVSGPELRRLRETAESWLKAIEDLRRGEFGQARAGLDRAARLAPEAAAETFAAVRRELESRQDAAQPVIERFYNALGGGVWAEILASAEAMLNLMPDHPAARQARSQAWQQIGALNPAADLPRRTRAAAGLATEPSPTARITEEPPLVITARSRPVPPQSGKRFLFWADGIGGYLVCLGDEIILGRASPDGLADVPVLGDLSRQHAILVRSGDGYLVRAIQPTFLNNRRIDAATLQNGDVLRLGSSVEFEFRQPCPASATARLQLMSRHRLPVAVDGVILMAETMLMGPSPQAHIPAPGLSSPVVLYRQNADLFCKAQGSIEVDGRPFSFRAPLTPRSSVLGEGFSFSLEPLGRRSETV